MTVETFSTLAQTTLNGAINNAVGALVVAANATFPQGGQFRIGVEPGTANYELMLVTAGGGSNNWTVTRGIEGTAASAHGDGSQIIGILTAGAMQRATARPDLQAGVLASGDAALTINSTTQVTVAAAEQIYVSTASGLLLPVSIASTALSGIAAPVTNPRLDMIVVDSNGVVTRVAGAETVGATIANRNGHGAVPSGSQLLHDLLVTVAGGVTAANTRDRRPWARGAFAQASSPSSDYATASTSAVVIDSTNLSLRMECTGNPMRADVMAGRYEMAGAGTPCLVLYVDGATMTGSGPYDMTGDLGPGSDYTQAIAQFLVTPAAGSHLFVLYHFVTASTGTLKGTIAPVRFIIEEVLRPNANNGTT